MNYNNPELSPLGMYSVPYEDTSVDLPIRGVAGQYTGIDATSSEFSNLLPSLQTESPSRLLQRQQDDYVPFRPLVNLEQGFIEGVLDTGSFLQDVALGIPGFALDTLEATTGGLDTNLYNAREALKQTPNIPEELKLKYQENPFYKPPVSALDQALQGAGYIGGLLGPGSGVIGGVNKLVSPLAKPLLNQGRTIAANTLENALAGGLIGLPLGFRQGDYLQSTLLGGGLGGALGAVGGAVTKQPSEKIKEAITQAATNITNQQTAAAIAPEILTKRATRNNPFTQAFSGFGRTLQFVAPKTGAALNTIEAETNVFGNRIAQTINDFTSQAKKGLKPDDYNLLQGHLLDAERKEAIALLKEKNPSLVPAANKAFKAFNELYEAKKAAGIEVPFQKGYWPRGIENYNEFTKAKGYDADPYLQAFNKAVSDAKEKYGKLTRSQINDIYNDVVLRGTGASVKNMSRKMPTVKPDLKFYSDIGKSAEDYVRSSVNQLTKARFLGPLDTSIPYGTLKAEADRLREKFPNIPEEDLFKIADDSLREGKNRYARNTYEEDRLIQKAKQIAEEEGVMIPAFKGAKEKVPNPEYVNAIKDNLESYFKIERSLTDAPAPVADAIKTVARTTLLSGLGQGVVQLSDLGNALRKHGLAAQKLIEVIQKGGVNLKTLGVQDVFEELGTSSKIKKYLDYALTPGLKIGDVAGKQGYTNIAMAQYANLAEKALRGDRNAMRSFTKSKPIKDYLEYYGDEALDPLLKDFAETNFNDRTNAVLRASLREIQPLSKMDMPRAYLNVPEKAQWLKLLWNMKSFSIKKFDNFMTDVVDPILNENNYGEAAKELVKYLTFTTGFEAATRLGREAVSKAITSIINPDAVKEEDKKFSDAYAESVLNIVPLGSKYQAEALLKGTSAEDKTLGENAQAIARNLRYQGTKMIGDTLTGSIFTPITGGLVDAADVLAGDKSLGDVTRFNTFTRLIPGIGTDLYSGTDPEYRKRGAPQSQITYSGGYTPLN